MRGAAGPERNDAQMHPPTPEKNARRSKSAQRGARGAMGRERCPREVFSGASSRHANVPGPIWALSVADRAPRELPFKNFQPPRLQDRVLRPP